MVIRATGQGLAGNVINTWVDGLIPSSVVNSTRRLVLGGSFSKGFSITTNKGKNLTTRRPATRSRITSCGTSKFTTWCRED